MFQALKLSGDHDKLRGVIISLKGDLARHEAAQAENQALLRQEKVLARQNEIVWQEMLSAAHCKNAETEELCQGKVMRITAEKAELSRKNTDLCCMQTQDGSTIERQKSENNALTLELARLKETIKSEIAKFSEDRTTSSRRITELQIQNAAKKSEIVAAHRLLATQQSQNEMLEEKINHLALALQGAKENEQKHAEVLKYMHEGLQDKIHLINDKDKLILEQNTKIAYLSDQLTLSEFKNASLQLGLDDLTAKLTEASQKNKMLEDCYLEQNRAFLNIKSQFCEIDRINTNMTSSISKAKAGLETIRATTQNWSDAHPSKLLVMGYKRHY